MPPRGRRGYQSYTKLQKIIGLPPDTYVSDRMMYNSMPVMDIIPKEPELTFGLTVFKLLNKIDEYKNILKHHKFELDGDSLKLAFVADNFPTDSFTNEYGESFLNKMSDVVSPAISEINQMMGASNLGESAGALRDMVNAMKVPLVGDLIQKGIDTSSNIKQNMVNAGKSGKMSGKAAQFLGESAGLLSRLATGARVDFPQVWKNSGFTPSYSATVRLYNPNPGNDESTKKYIVGPIAAILCLTLPRAGAVGEESNTYNWPFLHTINCPGIFKLEPAFISNVSVIKGGDQQQIAFNQVLSMVDVRIDMGSLYNSMLLETGARANGRPTLRTYLDNFTNTKKVAYNTKNEPFEITTEEYNRIFGPDKVETSKKQTNTIESDPDDTRPRVEANQKTIESGLRTGMTQ